MCFLLRSGVLADLLLTHGMCGQQLLIERILSRISLQELHHVIEEGAFTCRQEFTPRDRNV
ncbi:hypothetical protein D3C78_1866150 [compost metagenome]